MTILGLNTANRSIILALFTVVLAGCATAPVPIAVVSDSFCQASRKVTWHTDDTAETIQQIEQHNRSIDRACRKQRIASK